MRLIEKKCPGCGASLKFDDKETNVVCEYCNKTFYIQKDETKIESVDEDHISDAYEFVNEFGKPIAKAFMFNSLFGFFIVPFIIFFVIVFIIINVSIFHEKRNDIEKSDSIINVDNNIDGNNNEEQIKYVTKLSDIDSISLETFYDNSKANLHCSDNRDYTCGDWSKVGSYLLVSKDGKKNILYTVMKHTYTKKQGSKKVTLYAAMKYDNLKLNSNNIVSHSYKGISVTQDINLDGIVYNFANGYESVEKLYNHVIRPQSGEYTIDASSGLYIEG